MKIFNPVSLIVTNDSSEVLLVKPKAEWELFGDCWSLPGGVPEGRENFEQALTRSVREELRCRLKKFDYYQSSFFRQDNDTQFRSMYYHGLIDGDIMLSEKLSESQWFSIPQLNDPDVRLAADQKEVILRYFEEKRSGRLKTGKKKSLFNI